jgi:hypothetical protein
MMTEGCFLPTGNEDDEYLTWSINLREFGNDRVYYQQTLYHRHDEEDLNLEPNNYEYIESFLFGKLDVEFQRHFFITGETYSDLRKRYPTPSFGKEKENVLWKDWILGILDHCRKQPHLVISLAQYSIILPSNQKDPTWQQLSPYFDKPVLSKYNLELSEYIKFTNYPPDEKSNDPDKYSIVVSALQLPEILCVAC